MQYVCVCLFCVIAFAIPFHFNTHISRTAAYIYLYYTNINSKSATKMGNSNINSDSIYVFAFYRLCCAHSCTCLCVRWLCVFIYCWSCVVHWLHWKWHGSQFDLYRHCLIISISAQEYDYIKWPIIYVYTIYMMSVAITTMCYWNWYSFEMYNNAFD